MPKRTDIKKVLMIGSGPIIIGQACEFDYSGSQACKALREEGYEIVLINSNPATIMTDPRMADRTYIEPIRADIIEKIIARERPDAVLPTLGGQTGLNMAVFLARQGVFKKYGVEVLGADPEAITRAEDRDEFRKAMQEIGIQIPPSGIATTVEEGLKIAQRIGLPVILRPAFCLGGTGSSTAYNWEELERFLAKAIEYSPIGQVLVEQSVLGWKEIEFEVMRDCQDNVIMITSMENVDPMGVHTGDSAVVAPSQTLSAGEYARYVDYSKKIIRKVGITGGGANIQFAGNPDTGDIVIIEVNPRLSRSSALASKATGFPIARVATKLAVGLTLDEVMNQVTGKTWALFEPTVDYCVFKISRFTFEKFPAAERTINTSMKSVGEAMSIGRTFKEAFQKGIRSLEIARYGFGSDGKDEKKPKDLETIRSKLAIPNDERFFYIRYALEAGLSIDEIYELSKIDRWFVHNMKEIVDLEVEIRKYTGYDGLKEMPLELLRQAKAYGFSDRQLAYLTKNREETVYNVRKERGVTAVYKLVDTCAGEIDPERPYFYSTYEAGDECRATDKKKMVILGGGPNRIGQGIEFDYCCCHAAYALQEEGYEAIMINCNPETVSTDYDTSHRLYFEPMTREDILAVVEHERPEGVIVQLGGQTPLNLTIPLEKAGVKILGTSSDSIDRAEDRKRFTLLLDKLGLNQAPNGTGTSPEEAKKIATDIGYPVLVRPSYVLGGRAMEIVYDETDLERYMREAVEASPEHPVLVDKFLNDAIEVDVDAISDGSRCVIGGIMEHIEEAGVHSGDAACVLPPHSLPARIVEEMRQSTYALAKELHVVGLMNVQYAIQAGKVFVLEVNPRASRTVPFVSKSIGVSLANLATKVMLGKSLDELGFTKEVIPPHVCVKESVFPFNRFPGIDTVLGPEMKSTGEVMGIDKSFGMAFAKAQFGASMILPTKGTLFVSVHDKHKPGILRPVKKLAKLGFKVIATDGTANFLRAHGVSAERVHKVQDGRPNVIDLMKNHEIALVFNTPSGRKPREAESLIRSQSWFHNLPIMTTVPGAWAAAEGIEALIKGKLDVTSLQEHHQAVRAANP
jgi:carbamoyl-phosphate synthase large subunit